MSLDISISRNGETLAEINWLRNPFGLCQWAEDNTITPDSPYGLHYVCNAWAYGRSSQIDRKLFLTVVLDYWQQVQKLKHGYFWFAPRQYQQFVMPYAQFLSSRDGIKESKMRTAIPMEHFSHAAFDLGGAHTLEAYKNWFARLAHIAELLQSPDVDFYCSN